MSDAAWAAVLDSLESELQAVHRASGGRRMSNFVAPDGLGPLPHDLAARAHEVLAAFEAAQDIVRDEMKRTTEQLRELRMLDPRGPKPASSLDTRA